MTVSSENSTFTQLKESPESPSDTIRRELQALMERESTLSQQIVHYILKLHGGKPNAERIAEDIWSRVAEKVWTVLNQKPELLPTTASANTWTHTIARNMYFSDSRRRKRIEEREFSASGKHHLLNSSDDSANHTETTEQNERRALILQALDKLPDKLKETLKARALDEMTYEEISENLNVSCGTIKNRIHKARKRLQKILKNIL